MFSEVEDPAGARDWGFAFPGPDIELEITITSHFDAEPFPSKQQRGTEWSEESQERRAAQGLSLSSSYSPELVLLFPL